MRGFHLVEQLLIQEGRVNDDRPREDRCCPALDRVARVINEVSITECFKSAKEVFLKFDDRVYVLRSDRFDQGRSAELPEVLSFLCCQEFISRAQFVPQRSL